MAQHVAAGTSELVGKATDKAHEWASLVGAAAGQARDQVQQATSATVEHAGDFGKELTGLIRRYPVPAVLMVAGIGFLLGQVLHHSPSRKA